MEAKMKCFWAVATLMLVLVSSAGAVLPKPKHVFITSQCPESLGQEILASLRDAVRASPGYQLATSLKDDGGLGVVVTIFMSCSEVDSPGVGKLVSVASILGTGKCFLDHCNVTSNELTLDAMLCGNRSGERCGQDLYRLMDEYMTGVGAYPFSVLSNAGQGATAP